MYTIVVIDGKGGGIGSSIVKRLSSMKGEVKILAMGTNSQATVNMLKSGAHDGATGENAICHMVQKADLIIGPMAIVVSNSMMGEISPKVAQAIASSDAKKLLIPTQKCGISVLGVKEMTMAQMIESIPEAIKKITR
jgi:NAD(P)-dependent dehydrogenase (short-subunit alcohol dehydrogenase family)